MKTRICLGLFICFWIGADAAPFVVISTNDSGSGTLRQAISDANLLPGEDTIHFNIPGPGPHRIQPLSALPEITDSVVIDGTTQVGFGGSPIIELHGGGGDFSGLLVSASRSAIRGLVINGFRQDGIVIQGSRNRIEGNFIGTDVTGRIAIPNRSEGILVRAGADHNIIGGTDPVARNLISGNGLGMFIQSRDCEVMGNLIGTDITGTRALGNTGAGVIVSLPSGGSTRNRIGPGNVISGNWYNGISMGAVTACYVVSNRIGTDITGTQALSNGWHGVEIRTGATNWVRGNIISGNRFNGILFTQMGTYSNFVQGNFIGTDVTGTPAIGNGGSGIGIVDYAGSNVVGGASADAGNLISGNGIGAEDPFFFMRSGIRIGASSGNVVQGNRIGTDITGENALPNAEHGIHFIGGLTERNIIGGPGVAANLISRNTFSGIFIQNSCVQNYLEGNLILGNGENGVHMLDSPRNFIGSVDPAVKCVISGNGRHGVLIEGLFASSAFNQIRNCLIGTDPQGLRPYPNGSDGVHLRNGADATDVGPANVISGNQGSGVMCEGDTHDHTIHGNLIGTDASGASPLPNQYGVRLSGSSANLVGGVEIADRNVISGNQRDGIFIEGSEAVRNVIQGNLIGTDATGAAALGNGEHGVHVQEANETSIFKGSMGNVISANRGHGIFMEGGILSGGRISGSLIGTDVSGNHALGNGQSGIAIVDASGVSVGGPGPGRNTIAYNEWHGVHVRNGVRNRVRNNSIFANGLLGVNLGDDDVLANDASDPDLGANNLQNHPVLTSATYVNGQTTAQGILNSAPNTSFNIEFFANDACDPSGYGEGQSILSIQTVNTDTSGNAAFTVSFTKVALGQYITALATDGQNNTSEFSPCVQVTVPRLGFERSGQQMTLSWPNDPSLTLQCTTNLNSPVVWGPVTNQATVVGNEIHVTLDTSVGSKFFRLTSN